MASIHFTRRLAVADRITLPNWPLKVIVYVPEEAVTGNVNVAFAVATEPDKLTEVGDMAHVVFAGPPPQFSDTVPVKPFTGVTVSVYIAFFPEAVSDVGSTDKLKSTIFTMTPEDVLGLKFESPL
jgi:hypothetical protein